MFGRGLKLVKTKDPEINNIELLIEIIKGIYPDREITKEMFESILSETTSKLNKISLEIISQKFD